MGGSSSPFNQFCTSLSCFFPHPSFLPQRGLEKAQALKHRKSINVPAENKISPLTNTSFLIFFSLSYGLFHLNIPELADYNVKLRSKHVNAVSQKAIIKKKPTFIISHTQRLQVLQSQSSKFKRHSHTALCAFLSIHSHTLLLPPKLFYTTFWKIPWTEPFKSCLD